MTVSREALAALGVHSRPRWGFGNPAHEQLSRIISGNRPASETTLRSFLALADEFAAIPLAADPARPDQPNWVNPWLPNLDAIAIYGLLALHERNLYVEIGSGYSTKFARKAIRVHNHATRIISIDPCPRADIDLLCDETFRSPLEDIDLSLFDRLVEGDVLFLDSSHRSLMNSDVTVFFLEVILRLRPGVLLGIHETFLPYDYPPGLAKHCFSEQYLLACWLLAGSEKLKIELPLWMVCHDAELSAVLRPIYCKGPLSLLQPLGSTAWLRVGG